MPELCPCGSGQPYAGCCGQYINGTKHPPTADALMRSRFSAYVVGNVGYLVNTTHPSSRRPSMERDIHYTADHYTWLGLQIIETRAGAPEDKSGKVEFIAHFREPNGKVGVHRERSRFKKYKGVWYYLDAEATTE